MSGELVTHCTVWKEGGIDLDILSPTGANVDTGSCTSRADSDRMLYVTVLLTEEWATQFYEQPLRSLLCCLFGTLCKINLQI